MQLSTGGRLMLSSWNEVNKVKHRGKDNEIGIVSLTYLLGIGGIQIHISYAYNWLAFTVYLAM